MFSHNSPHSFIFQNKPKPPRPKPPRPGALRPVEVSEALDVNLEDQEFLSLEPQAKKEMLIEIIEDQLAAGADQEILDSLTSALHVGYTVPMQKKELRRLGYAPKPQRQPDEAQCIAYEKTLREGFDEGVFRTYVNYLEQFSGGAERLFDHYGYYYYAIDDLDWFDEKKLMNLQLQSLQNMLESGDRKKVFRAYKKIQDIGRYPTSGYAGAFTNLFSDLEGWRTSGQIDESLRDRYQFACEADEVFNEIEKVGRALVRYESENILVGVYFENLPQGERDLIDEVLQAQGEAVKLYGDKDNKGSTGELYIDNSTAYKVRDIDEMDILAERGNNFGFSDVEFYILLLGEHKYGVAGEQPHGPGIRIRNREYFVKFLQTRGMDMNPQIRGRIYIDLANSLLHEDIREQNPELANRLLNQGIELLETVCEDDGEGLFDTPPEISLAYAHYRRATLWEWNRDLGKSRVDVDGEWQKAIQRALEGTAVHSGSEFFTTPDMYLDMFERYLERAYFPGSRRRYHNLDSIVPSNERERKVIVERAIQFFDDLEAQLEGMDEEDVARIRSKIIDARSNVVWYFMTVEETDKYLATLEEGQETSKVEEWVLMEQDVKEKCREEWSTPEVRRETLGKWLVPDDPDLREEVLKRYENSPIYRGRYREIMDNGDPELYFELENEMAGLSMLYVAQLFDTASPANEVDLDRALVYYKEALKGSRSFNLSEIQQMTAVARCYRIINGLDRYDESDYSNLTWSGAGVMGQKLELEEDYFEIMNAPENLQVLYITPFGHGVAVNRYINLPYVYWWREKKEELLQLRTERKESLAQGTEFSDDKQARLEELQLEFNVQEIGDIYKVRIDPETGRLQALTEPLCDVSATTFPWDSVSAQSLGLIEQRKPEYSDYYYWREYAPQGGEWYDIQDTQGINGYVKYDEETGEVYSE
ncbi:hypothetical protein HN748_01555 [Candidatus Peregrinibacteria bacterium]|jgi:hypothetical protein|nr:hypothetical protein [Candidatus Peregrinibacteria bacterium]MBT7702897.1 hypothetical protein [Candidatus Peregrinibacteria bacterium]